MIGTNEKQGLSRHHREDGGDNSSKRRDVPEWLLPHFRTYVCHVPGFVSLIERIMENGDLKPHPQYVFGNINKVHRGRFLIMGDAADMATP